MQALTGGKEQVRAAGSTVRELIADLELSYPGMFDRLCEDDRVKPTIAVVVNGEISTMGVRQKVPADAEVNFLPAISGG